MVDEVIIRLGFVLTNADFFDGDLIEELFLFLEREMPVAALLHGVRRVIDLLECVSDEAVAP